jgi:hypothetical protein
MKFRQNETGVLLTSIISLLVLSACEDNSMGPDAYQQEKPLKQQRICDGYGYNSS